jgi:hypothetical protein
MHFNTFLVKNTTFWANCSKRHIRKLGHRLNHDVPGEVGKRSTAFPLKKRQLVIISHPLPLDVSSGEFPSDLALSLKHIWFKGVLC